MYTKRIKPILFTLYCSYYCLQLSSCFKHVYVSRLHCSAFGRFEILNVGHRYYVGPTPVLYSVIETELPSFIYKFNGEINEKLYQRDIQLRRTSLKSKLKEIKKISQTFFKK